MKIWDVAVIGAGMSGLTCARIWQDLGHSVVIVEKSRGVGGRVATRRMSENIRVDHGACYFKPKGDIGKKFLNDLINAKVVQKWEGEFWQTTQIGAKIEKSPFNDQFIATSGISAIAKYLSTDLEILFQKRAVGLNLDAGTWQIVLDDSNIINAKALAIAIPAPQAASLLATIPPSQLNPSTLDQVNAITYNPCFSIMAGYSSLIKHLPSWNAFTFTNDEFLGWIGFDSRKRYHPQPPIFTMQTSAKFAKKYLEIANLQTLIPLILDQVTQATQLAWFKNPEWVKIHRWLYAFPTQHLSQKCLLAISQPPLVLCGDWCHQSTSSLIENAIVSGIAATETIHL